MQIDISQKINIPGGGRIASPKLRLSQEQCEEFDGLDKNANRYDLLLLVKRVGKAAGFSPRMITLLDYYMSFTRDIDWEEGGRPIVYQSLAKTALDMGVSERQIQILENQLFDLGLSHGTIVVITDALVKDATKQVISYLPMAWN